jgi:hypothetical protein
MKKITPELKKVESVTEFIERVLEIRKKWLSDDPEFEPWFRGHQKEYWPLEPQFYRSTPHAQNTEYELREEFVRRAPIFSEHVPTNEWEWYFLMQHYGAPTRLLDWTESALSALYFAIRNNPGYHDAAVWILDPWELNEQVLGKEDVLLPGDATLTRKEQRSLDRWLPARFARNKRLPRQPIAVYPPHVEKRISAQRSCFTIHGSDVNPFEKFAAKDNPCILKITIPSYCVQKLAEELVTCGVDETTIFPELGGLAKSLGTKWQNVDNKKPHNQVFTRLGVSKIHGIGVFAIRKIKKGQSIFPNDQDEGIWIKKEEVPKTKQIRKLYADFGVLQNGRYLCPLNFNRLRPSWYLNHSNKPNVRWKPGFDFVAVRHIRAGEELTVDYFTYSENPLS